MRYSDLIGRTHEEVGGCWGLIADVYRREGVKVPFYGEGPVEDTDRIVELAESVVLEPAWSERDPGETVKVRDVLYFRGPGLAHVGVAVSPTEMLHSLKSTGVVLERFRPSPRWELLLDSVFYTEDSWW